MTILLLRLHPDIQTPRISSKILRCASFFQLSSRCLDVRMKHCHSCLIYCLHLILQNFTLLLTTFGTYALVGEHERFVEEGREQNIRANKLILHPDSSLANLGDALALIRLKHGVKFSPFVRTVCLPKPTDVFYVRPGKSCVIAGWGSSRRVSVA